MAASRGEIGRGAAGRGIGYESIIATQRPLAPRGYRWLSPALAAAMLAGCGFVFAADDPPASADAPAEILLAWKDGLRFTDRDGRFEFGIGGRIQYDWDSISGDRAIEERFGPLEGGSEFRRARLRMAGRLPGSVEFEMEYDFAGGSAEFKDVTIALVGLPFGDLIAGHQKEPLSLEELTSDSRGAFAERSLMNAFAPSRSNGILLRDSKAGVAWTVGAFRTANEVGEAEGEGHFALTARIAGSPLWEDGGRRLVHVGAAYSHRHPRDGEVRFAARPEIHLAPRLADTSQIPADAVSLSALELAVIAGPVAVQAEAIRAAVDSPSGKDPSFVGWYAQASWVLTGEIRGYDREEAKMKGVFPEKNFVAGGDGWGAVELALRASHIDLDDGPVTGGVLDAWALGANWYLSRSARIVVDFVSSHLSGTGRSDGAVARLQVDF